MDDDGFYMAEIDGVRGLVPSNFLTEANDQYSSTGGPGYYTILYVIGFNIQLAIIWMTADS